MSFNNAKIEALTSTLKLQLDILKRQIDNDDLKECCNDMIDNIDYLLKKQAKHIDQLNIIGSSLSTESSIENLLDMIIEKARMFTNADAGTLYMLSDDKKELVFEIVENDQLDIHLGLGGDKIDWPKVQLFLENDEKNVHQVAALSALESKVINIPDVYNAQGFNFDGTKKFDANTGYRSKSMLVIPMINNNLDVIGVLQLINALGQDGNVVQFTKDDEETITSLTSQAAVAITNVRMIEGLNKLLESFISSIAFAVDSKSPHTGGHVQKVAEITLMIANAINGDKEGTYKDINYTEEELNEIRIAALMHDVGKITTPEHVVDKGTKLETIYDRINDVKLRVEILRRDYEIDLLKKRSEYSDDNEKLSQLENEYSQKIEQLEDDFEFLKNANIGGEFMKDEDIERVEKLSNMVINVAGEERKFLSEDEVENLSIRRGTLTQKELEKMREHVVISNDMLERLPFPDNLKRVPAIAGGHHEKMNGKGYPNGLSADELSLESRMLALADIFEALSSADRPYKSAKKMSEINKIIGFCVKDYELDPDLVKFFYDNNIHNEYAKKFLDPSQLDV
jgi:HD-GYP domain-containing protein (c-di-GMP phosphodiesterase class II)